MQAAAAYFAEIGVAGKCILVALASMVPVAEVKVAILLGAAWQLKWYASWLCAWAGSSLLVPLLLHRRAQRERALDRMTERAYAKHPKMAEFLRKYGCLGMFLIIAFPFSGIGCWLGSLFARFLHLDPRRACAAIVCGNLKEDSGTVDAPIGRHPTDRKKMCVTARGGRDAVTHWEVVRRYKGYTHIRCRLETGRTHQIRVHMAHIGHPILGDTVYGRKKPELGQDSQCLHASALSFRHPRTGQMVLTMAELPEYFRQVCDKLERMQ